jgi:hypothetical protein
MGLNVTTLTTQSTHSAPQKPAHSAYEVLTSQAERYNLCISLLVHISAIHYYQPSCFKTCVHMITTLRHALGLNDWGALAYGQFRSLASVVHACCIRTSMLSSRNSSESASKMFSACAPQYCCPVCASHSMSRTFSCYLQ